MSETISSAVRAAEKRRCAAMIANDPAGLDAILDPRLHFAHANGGVDGKDVYLTKMASGRIVYRAIRWSEEAVTELADGVAMLTGRMDTDVLVDETEKSLKNRVISVWGQTAGGWRLVAFQSTPLPA